MKKNYNNARPKLHLPEYGRHIHQMVDALCLIEDRAERNKQARAVIAVMGNVNPLLRDTPVFTHKLWDHLFMISDFQLDVDSPYEQPTRDHLEVKPLPIRYPQCRISHKHYGKYAGRIIKKLSEEPQDVVDETVGNIAVFMRAKSFEYNQEHPNNEAILKEIKFMANGAIEINEDIINNIQSDYKQHVLTHQHSFKPQQRGGNNSRGNNYKNRREHSNNRGFNKNAGVRRNQPKQGL